MAEKGRTQNLTPWKPGETGNPAGSSAKQRNRAYLKDVLPQILSEHPTAAELDELELDPKVRAAVEALSYLDIGARRIVADFAFGKRVDHVDAARTISACEPKQHEIAASLSASIEITSEHEWGELAGSLDRLQPESEGVATNGSNGSAASGDPA